MVFQRTGGAVAGKLAYEDSNTAIAFGTTTSHELKLLANNTRAIQINSGGDIIFYDDAGTSEDLFWDAEESRLGIGTTSPASLIHGMSGDLFLTANSTAADSGQGIYFQSTTSGWTTSSAHGAIFGKRVDGSNGYLRFDTRSGGTTEERMRIDSSGDVEVSAGNLVIGTAGKGIDFSAQTATSATGAATGDEVLDHYEEGTWTATIGDDSANSNAISGAQLYTKIGRVVTIMFEASNLNTTGLVDEVVRISGLPFTSNSATKHHGMGNGWWHDVDMGGKAQFCFVVTNNVAHVNIRASDADGSDEIVNTGEISDGTADLYFNVTYFA